VGLSPTFFDTGKIWSGYALDMAGPAWVYILFRGLFTAYANNAWTRFFTPIRTFLILLTCSFFIEGLQYFEVYKSTYDPLDFVAYGSILIPVFLLDNKILKASLFQNNKD